jgi:Integrase zinc binding domain
VRYLGDLVEYDFKLVHKPGKLNKADHLSRRPDYNEGKADNEDMLVLLDQLFARALSLMDMEQWVYDLQGTKGQEIQDWARTMPLNSVNHHWFYRAQPVVAMDQELRRDILCLYHNHATAGHPGITNTYKAVAKDYWWPDLKRFMEGYVKGCATCQSTKPNTVRPHIPMFPISNETPMKLFQVISWDLVTDLPKAGTLDSILTIVDQGCTKMAIFIPCMKEIDAEGVATLYAEKVFPHYRIPGRIISDRDPHFTAKFAEAVCKMLGIMQNISMAYHPQMDGQLEWVNARVEQYLQIYGNAEQDDWPKLLPLAQYVHNSWENASMGYTPFELLLGHTPSIHLSHERTPIPTVEQRKEWLKQVQKRVSAAIKEVQQMLTKRTE